MLIKNRIFCSLGSVFEWFDFALYGFLGPIFAQVFFSHVHKDAWVALMHVYLIFAIGFAARPLGGLIFGYLGDRYGRIFALKITPLSMTVCTTFMALLPTYKFAGNTAVVLLIVTRISQGIVLGGEFAGNIVYLYESSYGWKYFWSSIGSCSGSLGIILASIIASLFYSLFSHAFMYTYGWRLAFLCVIPLGIVAFYARLKIPDSLKFKGCFSQKNPMRESIFRHRTRLFLCVGIVYLHATSFYFVFVFLPVFFNKIRHLQESAALVHNTLFLVIHLCFIPIFGFIVNLAGGLRSQFTISLLFLFLSLPIFCLIAYGTSTQIMIGLLLFSVMTAINAAIIPGLLSSLIPMKIRYTIFALSFNIGFGIFGGITPFIGLFLIRKSGRIWMPSVYLTLAALITLFVSYIAIKMEGTDEIRKIRIA